MSDPNAELEQRIRERAYFIWLAEGRPEGRSTEFWDRARALEAGAALSAEDRRSPAVAKASTPSGHPPEDRVGSPSPGQAGDTSPLRVGSSGLSSGAGLSPQGEPRWPSSLLALAALLTGGVWMARRFGTPRGSRQ